VETGRFQEAGLIRYRRGHIDILKPDGLKEAACECYAAISKRFDRLNKLGIVDAAQGGSGSPCVVREAANIRFADQRGVIRPHFGARY
jgi:hypothetical protein